MINHRQHNVKYVKANLAHTVGVRLPNVKYSKNSEETTM